MPSKTPKHPPIGGLGCCNVRCLSGGCKACPSNALRTAHSTTRRKSMSRSNKALNAFLDARSNLCYTQKSMLSRIIISAAMAVALFTAPVGVAARSCILSNAPSQKACQPSCCANKTCCATSPKNTAPPSQPLAKADSGQQLSATCFAVALPFSNYEVGTEQFRFQAVAPLANSPPRQALLCTFLI